MKLKYYAWVRQYIQLSEEELTIPEKVTTIAQLIDHLKTISPGHAKAFSQPDVIRCAINFSFCDHSTSIANASEIAFFPPVTGG